MTSSGDVIDVAELLIFPASLQTVEGLPAVERMKMNQRQAG